MRQSLQELPRASTEPNSTKLKDETSFYTGLVWTFSLLLLKPFKKKRAQEELFSPEGAQYHTGEGENLPGIVQKPLPSERTDQIR